MPIKNQTKEIHFEYTTESKKGKQNAPVSVFRIVYKSADGSPTITIAKGNQEGIEYPLGMFKEIVDFLDRFDGEKKEEVLLDIRSNDELADDADSEKLDFPEVNPVVSFSAGEKPQKNSNQDQELSNILAEDIEVKEKTETPIINRPVIRSSDKDDEDPVGAMERANLLRGGSVEGRVKRKE